MLSMWRGNRQADQADRRRRGALCAGGLLPRAHRRPHGRRGVGLVEKAIETVELDKAEAIARKVKKGAFDLDDLAEQLEADGRSSAAWAACSTLPGLQKKQNPTTVNLDDKILKCQQAMIGSMKRAEQPEAAQRFAQEARGGGWCRTSTWPGEDAPADGRHDEGHGQETRHARRLVRRRTAAGNAGRTTRPAVCRKASFSSSPGGFPAFQEIFPARHCRAASPACRIEETMKLLLARRTRPCH